MCGPKISVRPSAHWAFIRLHSSSEGLGCASPLVRSCDIHTYHRQGVHKRISTCRNVLAVLITRKSIGALVKHGTSHRFSSNNYYKPACRRFTFRYRRSSLVYCIRWLYCIEDTFLACIIVISEDFPFFSVGMVSDSGRSKFKLRGVSRWRTLRREQWSEERHR